ncbi:DgyrCDS845 [Dimorphilus gyrociliatus]|uniref:DgyrCDS845 n=1 Tax=Dimorphilus gyrociliatus TaxID=2664684 RepID=A0A7I8V7L2_9ANNE|nr:DgyrCDS845 [Dimorphilus gyrociliatus]
MSRKVLDEWKNIQKSQKGLKTQRTENSEENSATLSSFGYEKNHGNEDDNKEESNQFQLEANVKSDQPKTPVLLRKKNQKGVMFTNIQDGDNIDNQHVEIYDIEEEEKQVKEDIENDKNRKSAFSFKRRKSRLASVYLEEKLMRRSLSICGGLVQHYISPDQKYMGVKAIIFFLVGLIICTIAFGFSYIGKLALKSKEDDKWPTVTGFIIMIVFSMVFSMTLLFSPMMRCIGALMVPAIFSINNGEIGGKQAICLYNQSKLTLQQVQSDIKEEWNGTIETFKKFTGTWKGIMKELSRVIKNFAYGNLCENGPIEFQFNIRGKRYKIDACYLTNDSVPIVPKIQIIHKGPKVESLKKFAHILSELCPLAVLLILLQAILYRRGYLGRLNYENVFITKYFVELDKKKATIDENLKVLPLRRRESLKYGFTTKCIAGYTRRELRGMVIPVVTFLCSLLIGITAYAGDFFFHFILDKIQQQLTDGVTVTSSSPIGLNQTNVKPIVSKLFDSVYSGLNIDNKTVEINITRCRMELNHPAYRQEGFKVIIVLYAIYFLLVLLHPGGSRVQRYIMSVFHPQQEKRRIQYLHYTIRAKRMSLFHLITTGLRKKPTITFKQWLSLKFPTLKKCFACLRSDVCDICSAVSMNIVFITKYKVCICCQRKLVNEKGEKNWSLTRGKSI